MADVGYNGGMRNRKDTNRADASAHETRENGCAMRTNINARWANAAARADRALSLSKLANKGGRMARAIAYAEVAARWAHIAKKLAERMDRPTIQASF